MMETPCVGMNCGNNHANHYHYVWDCPVNKEYWRGVNNALQDIFKGIMPLEINIIFFGCIH